MESYEIPPHPQIPTVYQMRLKNSQKKLPRFLFRAFDQFSGGGYPGLNTIQGIVPHGFLDGHPPTSIWNIRDLRGMIDGHLVGSKAISSHFSSWAACLHFAVDLARIKYESNKGTVYIAILDTLLLDPHVDIYHVVDLHQAYLALDSFTHEYLAYGPITGRAYHCVSLRSLQNMGLKKLIKGRPGLCCGGHGLNIPKQVRIMSSQVAVAKKVAALFRRPDDSRPDVIIALTVALVYLRPRTYPSLRVFRKHLAEEINALGPLLPRTKKIARLANPRTFQQTFWPLAHSTHVILGLEFDL